MQTRGWGTSIRDHLTNALDGSAGWGRGSMSPLASTPERGRDASGRVEALRDPPSVMIGWRCRGNPRELAKDQ